VRRRLEDCIARGGIPDMRFINRSIPIAEVAAAVGIRTGQNGNLHCWHPERHQHGDRTASVGIRATNNTVKCFGCDSSPMGPLDLVMDVLGHLSVGDAAVWIAERFRVPIIPKRRRITADVRAAWPIGLEGPLGVLIRSGLWTRLSEATQSIAPVLVEHGERSTKDGSLLVKISYRGITRYSGVDSPNAVSKALSELAEIGWLTRVSEATLTSDLRRPVGEYLITPHGDQLMETAHHCYAQHRLEIDAERELRRRMRKERLTSKNHNGSERMLTK
jgi:hypothetical protein